MQGDQEDEYDQVWLGKGERPAMEEVANPKDLEDFLESVNEYLPVPPKENEGERGERREHRRRDNDRDRDAEKVRRLRALSFVSSITQNDAIQSLGTGPYLLPICLLMFFPLPHAINCPCSSFLLNLTLTASLYFCMFSYTTGWPAPAGSFR